MPVADAGVVDDDVDGADLGERRFDLGQVADVDAVLAGGVAGVPGEHDDVAALVAEALDGGGADAARAAGDEHTLVCQAEHVGDSIRAGEAPSWHDDRVRRRPCGGSRRTGAQ